MPLYYGIWAFTVASANSSVIHEASIQVCESTGSEACFLACEQSAPALQSSNPFIKAWHVVDQHGAERVVLLHKDPKNNAVPADVADVTIVPVPASSSAVCGWSSLD